MKNNKQKVNFKTIINEELRGMEARNHNSKINLSSSLEILDETVKNLELELLDIELTEHKSTAIHYIQECINFINSTRRKLTRI